MREVCGNDVRREGLTPMFYKFTFQYFCCACEALVELAVPTAGHPTEALAEPRMITHACPYCRVKNLLVIAANRPLVKGRPSKEGLCL